MIKTSQCAFCAHFHADDTLRDTCTAFPDGIPREVLYGAYHDHTLPYPGDHGVRFKPRDKQSEEWQRHLFQTLPVHQSGDEDSEAR